MSASLLHVRAEDFEANRIEPTGTPSRRLSLLDYSPALILVAIAIADSQRWADPDLWGHVRFGQAVLALGHRVLHDPYSYSAPGHLWLNHEWFSEVLMASLYNTLGIIGLKLMKFACTAGIVFFLALGLGETEAPMLAQFAVLLWATVAIAPQIQFRPQIFTFALLSCLFAILSRYNCRRRIEPVWLAVPILALWANLHGGFIMGLAALGVFTGVASIQDLMEGRGIRRALILVAITAAATLATFATPYGIGTWQAVLHALANPHTRMVVVDWQSLPKAMASQMQTARAGIYYIVLAILMFAALGYAFCRTPHGSDLALVCVAAVMIIAAFTAIRNLPIAIIATAIPLARHLGLIAKRRRERYGLPEPKVERATSANQLILIAFAVMLSIQTGLLSRRLISGTPNPDGAIAFMKKHGIGGNIMAAFGWGEYVIWHMSPPSKVFIDGRYDTIFPRGVINDYLTFHYAEPGAKQFLGKYPHDFILMDPRQAAAYKLMIAQPNWKQIYVDVNCILFARADSWAAAITPVTRSSHDTPKSYFP